MDKACENTNRILVKRISNGDTDFVLYPREYGYYLTTKDSGYSTNIGQLISPQTAKEIFVREDGSPL